MTNKKEMLKHICKANVLFALLCINFLLGQESNKTDFSVFAQYGSWGINITPVLFNKAKTEVEYGTTKLNIEPVYHGVFGFTKRFLKDKEWSIISGIYLTPIVSGKLSFSLKAEDLDVDWDIGETFNEEFPASSFYFLSVPVLAEHKIQMGQNLYFNSNFGFVFTYTGGGGFDKSVGYISNTDTDTTIFIQEEVTSRGNIKAGGLASAGFYILYKKFMLKINLEYKHNFKPLLEGYYEFINLVETPPTRGRFINSNNYFGISTTVFFKKRRKMKKLKQKNTHPFFN